MSDTARIVARRTRAPRLETERVRRRLAARVFGVALPPPTIGHYEVVERIGFGAQGDVYLVHDPRLRRRLAIKVLRHDLGGDALDEARALARIEHPNVVAVFDVGVVPGGPDEGDRAFLVMEYVDGGSLDAWRHDATIGSEARLAAVLGAGRGLAAAHAAAIVHGDFKPSNVVVTRQGQPKVTDFGLARSASTQPTPPADGGGGGTLGYRAPECDDHRPDARSDQFGFCATARKILAGPGASVRPSARVDAVLARGLDDDPARRWPDMPTLLDALERAARPRRGRWIVAGGLVVAGVALVARAGSDASASARARTPAALRAWSALEGMPAVLALHRGTAAWKADATDEARTYFETATQLAAAAGDDPTYARAAIGLVKLLGTRTNEFDDAARWERDARAAIARTDDADLRAELDLAAATATFLAGDLDAARRRLHALRRRLRDGPPSTSVHLGDVFALFSRIEMAADDSRAALHWAELGVQAELERGGSDDVGDGDALRRLGAAQEQRGDFAAARANLERALEIYERHGDETRALAGRNSLAIVLDRQGHFDAAEREYTKVLEAVTARGMDDFVVVTRVNLSTLALARDDAELALEHLNAARRLAEELYPEAHPTRLSIARGLGVAYGRLDRYEEAVAHLQRAVDGLEAAGAPKAAIGSDRYVLGQARWGLPGARARARAEVERGLEELKSDPEAYADRIAEAQSWLAQHPVDATSAPPSSLRDVLGPI